MSQTPLSPGSVSASTTSTLREACADLIRRLRSGDDARAERWFETFPALAADAEAAIELIYTEFATCDELGRRPDAAEYLRRFPQWTVALERQFDIHRLLAGDEPVDTANRRALDELGSSEIGSNGKVVPGIADVVKETSTERFGAYEIVRLLGRGGMGTVYLATHVELGRLAAVKILHGAGSMNASSGALAERFRTEVRSAAALGHPQIVQLYELGETPDGRLFAAFEYVEGGSLAASLGGRPRPAREAAELIRSLAAALDRAHKAGIVHCDLTPANILLARDGTPKIADFGLARLPKSAAALDEQLARVTGARATAAGAGDDRHEIENIYAPDYAALSSVALAGTPGYLAPERIDDPSAATPAADIYGLGATFYELLTGRPPHVGATPLETLRQARDYDPPSPRELVPNLPRDCATICLKCLERDPQRRYRDAAALAEDLRRFLAGEPIAARPVGSVERAWKWSGRHRGWAAAILATTAALILLAIGVAQYNAVLRQALKDKEEKELRIEAQTKELAEHVESLNRNVYTMQLNQAEALVDRAPHQSLALLRDETRCPPALRDFAWGMLLRQASQERRTLLGHAAPVWCIAERGDGMLVTAALDDTVRVWKSAEEQAAGGASVSSVATSFPVTTAGATLMALSPDGSRLAAAYDDHSIRTWNLAAGSAPRDLHGHAEAVVALVYFSGGRWLASAGDDGTMRIWDPAGSAIAEWRVAEPGEILSLTASPDDKTMAVGLIDGRVLLVDSISGPIALNGDAELQPTLAGKLDGVAHLLYSADGKQLAVVGVSSNKIELWNVAERKLVRTIDLGGSVARSAALSRDGRYLAYATSEQTLVVVDLTTGSTTAEYRGHTERIGALRFTADGKAVVSASDDRTVKLWDVPGERVPRLVAGDALKNLSVAFSNDGRTTAIAGFEGPIQIVRADDEAAGRKPMVLTGHAAAVRALRFLPEDKQLVSCGEDNTVRLWDLKTGENVRTWQQPAWVMDIAVTPDGRACYTAGADGHVRVVMFDEAAPAKIGNGNILSEAFDITAHAASINALALWEATPPPPNVPERDPLASGSYERMQPILATASRDGAVKLWHAGTGKLIGSLTGHSGMVRSLAYSSHGSWLAAGDDAGCVTVWIIDVRYLVMVEKGVPVGNLWIATNMALLHTLRGHSKGVYAVAVSPDGRMLASASGGNWVQAGGEVKLWDVASGQVHATLDGYSAPLAFRGDGLMLAVGLDPSRQIAFWPALPYGKHPIPAIPPPAAEDSQDKPQGPPPPEPATVP